MQPRRRPSPGGRRRVGPVTLALPLLLAGGLAACGTSPAARHGATGAVTRPAVTTPAASSTPPAPAAPPDPARVRANELGEVPVLMFHQVLPDPRGDYDISPGDFRALLEELAGHGYVPVTAADYAAGRIEIPAGTSPVVLTFDDSTRSQFALGGGDQVAPMTAVGILLDVAARHPGFTPVATFYINAHPFGQDDPKRYLSWLVAHHFEIGNHTVDHANLRELAPGAVQQELGDEQRQIAAAVPGYPVTTMALPFGMQPRQPELARSGGTGADSYAFRAVMLVGANPAPSPFSAQAGPEVPRIRAASRHVALDAQYWLSRLEPVRYVSAGDPAHVTFPRAEATQLSPAFAARARPY